MTSATQTWTEEATSVAGLNVRVLQGGSGPPAVVLHHSTGGPGWIPFYDQLAERFSLSAPDLAGFGGSDRPTWARHPRDLALLLQRTLDKLGLDTVTLIGLGFGGWVAAELATMHQQRLSGLVLVGAPGIQPEEGEIADVIMFELDDYMKAGFRDDAAYAAIFGEEASDEAKELWDFSREMTVRVTWKPWMYNRPLPHLLAEVETPSLLIWGEQDRIVPVNCGELYAKTLPNARLEVIKGAGHLVELEEPEQIAKLIGDFAASH